MPKYISRKRGVICSPTDPDRAVWYGMCSYWTDDWERLKSANGIPICPHCRSPGFLTDYRTWIEGAAAYAERPGNEDYQEFLLDLKHRCRGRVAITELYHLYKLNKIKEL